MEFGIGWKVVLLVIAQLIVLASGRSTEGDNVAMSKNDTNLANGTDLALSLNGTSRMEDHAKGAGANASNQTDSSVMEKIGTFVCQSTGFLCSNDHNETLASADAPSKTKVRATTLENEKGRNENEKNSTPTEADKGAGKEKDSRSGSSSDSSAVDKNPEFDP